jgi:hypothetical protein
MKWNRSNKLCLLFAGAIALSAPARAVVVGTAFTYQGRLSDAGAVANGSYDLRFNLRDAPSGGAQVGIAITNAAVTISNGFFTVMLDFGVNAFDGSARWLEIAVRQGANDFTVLSPRQPLTPTPYALTAVNLANPATVLSGTFTGTFAGDGSSLTNVNLSVAIVTPAPSGQTNFVVDFAVEVAQLTATNHLYLLESTNRPADGAYRESVWYIQGGTTNWTLRFSPSWTALGTLATNVPFVIASNKLTVVALAARGGSESNVTYAIARQE